MKIRFGCALTAAFLLGIPGIADDKEKAPDRRQSETAYREGRDADVTYGRIKELKAGQRVVIDIDNALDKSFDLEGADESVNMAADLKIGDPVKITEHKVNGKKTINIVRHADPDVRHGDKDKSAGADRLASEPDVTYGRIKAFNEGRIIIDVDNAVDKQFNLADNEPKVNVGAGLAVGDPVKVTEREINGRKTVQIVKHTGGNVRHGDSERNK
jgi:hypothetical protein